VGANRRLTRGSLGAKTVVLVVIVLVACGAGFLGLGMPVMRQRWRQAQQDAKSGRLESDQSADAPAVSSRPGEDPKGDSVRAREPGCTLVAAVPERRSRGCVRGACGRLAVTCTKHSFGDANSSPSVCSVPGRALALAQPLNKGR
jgi:hypothetical protein